MRNTDESRERHPAEVGCVETQNTPMYTLQTSISYFSPPHHVSHTYPHQELTSCPISDNPPKHFAAVT